MSGTNDQSSAAIALPGEEKPLEFKERIDHFAAGYNNSQAVVRFLDTKASAVIGVIPIVIAALSALFGLFKDWGRWEAAFKSDYHWWLCLFVVSVFLSSLAMLYQAVRAIVAAFDVISPRKTGSAKPSVIFPISMKCDLASPDDSFVSRAQHFVSEATRRDALVDYRRQVVRMSEIVDEKMACLKTAIQHLKRFFVFALVLLSLVCVTVSIGAVIGTPKAANGATPTSRPANLPATHSP